MNININSLSSVPKYIQVADSILLDVKLGKIKKGQKLSSITELSQSCNLSRDTIEKAYRYLQSKNIIYSVKGIGNFISSNDSSQKLSILFLINKPSSYKMEMYSSFVNTIGVKGNVTLSLYYCDDNIFVKILKKESSSFDYFVLMPHFKSKALEHVSYTDKALKAIESISKDRLILLDNIQDEITGNYAAIYQDFKNDIYQALEQGLERLRKYEKIILVYPKKAIYPYPQLIMTGFKSFCMSYDFNFEIMDNIYDNLEFETKDVYIIIQESDLVNLIKQIKLKNLILGIDVGIISYNETPLKALLDITVISTDFIEMGRNAAKLVLSNKKKITKNRFNYIERSSV